MPDGEHLLFSYFEYTGSNMDEDMAKMAANETVQKWWGLCKPCLESVIPLEGDEVWAGMTSIFFHP